MPTPEMNAAPPQPSTQHQHGGCPAALFERYGLKPRPVTDLSVNLNPLGIPPVIRKAWPHLLEMLMPYPSPEGNGVHEFYQKRFGLPSTSILPGNGSIELMYFVAHALPVQRVLIVRPAFHDYERAVLAAGKVATFVARPPEEPWSVFFRSEAFQHALAGADAVFLGSPNNPDGQAASRQDLLALCEAHTNKLFLVDQAFVQFLFNENSSLLHPKDLRPNLLVFHSLTKFYALAGLRLGALVGHPERIAQLHQARSPWAVNALAESCARLLLEDSEYEKQTHQWLQQAGRDMDHSLEKIASIEVLPAQTNFRLIRLRAAERYDALLRELLARGIHVRCCRNYSDLGPGYFRVSLNLPEINAHFVHTLNNALRAIL